MRLPQILLLVALLFVPSLMAQEADEAEEDPKVQGIYFRYAIFLPEPYEGDIEKKAHELHKEKYSDHLTFKAPVTRLTQGSYMTFQREKTSVYPPPAVEYLQFKGFGVSEDQAKKIQTSEELLLIDFFIVRPENYDYLIAANGFVYDLAQSFKGLIWDDETRELFSPEIWEGKRLSLNIHPAVANSTLHGYPARSGFIAVTLGLRKLGQPDLVITEFPEAYWKPISTLMEFLIVQVSQNGPLSPKETFTSEEVRSALGLNESEALPAIDLVEVEIEEGATKNRMLTVDFSKYPGEDIHEQHAHLIRALLRPSDDVLAVIGNRELLLKTSEEARAELKGKEETIKEGLKPGERIVIKAFMHDEYLWIALDSWEGGLIKGTVEAEPLVTRDVKAGDSIEVPFDRVFDYVHIKPDGSMEGNETGKLIERLQEEAREAAPESETETEEAP